jgi:MFS family permease
VAVLACYASFAQLVESEEPAKDGLAGASVDWRAVLDLLQRDRNFARFVVGRALVLSIGVAAPFYSVFARQRLGAPTAMAGTYLGAYMFALVASTLLWGRLSDRHGNRRLLLVAGALHLAAPAMTLLLGTRLSYTAFTLVFLLLGTATAGTDIACLSLTLAPGPERALYLGVINTALGVVSFALIAGGLIVQRWGLEAIVVFSLTCALAAMSLVGTVKDPLALS